MLENRLRHSEGARVKLKKSITGWLRRHGVTDPVVLVGRENSRKHGEHSHWIIACPPHLVAALVEHVQKALLRIDQRAALPPRTWWWTRPTVVRALHDGTTRRVAAGWSFNEYAVQQGHLPYALKQLVPPGEWIEGVFGTHDRRPSGRRLRVVTRRTARQPVQLYQREPDPLAAAPAACQGHEPRPIAVAVEPVADMPPAPERRPTVGGNRMHSFQFRPLFTSESGRQEVRKAASVGLTAAGVKAFVDGAVRRGAGISAEQVDLAAKRVRELIAQARSPAEAAGLRKLLTDTLALRLVPAAVGKAAERAAAPPGQEPGSGLPTDADLAAMEQQARRLLARAPAEDKPRLETLLADIAAMRAALARGAVLKSSQHPLRLRALARAEAATRELVVKSARGGVHPLVARARARAAGGLG